MSRAIPMAAADPTVPGASGERPHPNQVEMALAALTRIAIVVRLQQVLGARRSGDHVLLRGPVAEVDDAAALAAKRRFGVARLHGLLADRALHDVRHKP